MDQREGYAPGWSDDALVMMSARSADQRARFVMPFLSPRARVLDVGCGPGTITVGLAQTTPGISVLGVDCEESQVELARERAARAGVSNARFEQGSVYELPVGDEQLDVVFAHALFEHLASPADALTEIMRVLHPGGVVALSSSDWSAARIDPLDHDVDLALQGHYLLRRQAGGDPFRGGALPALLSEAGFADTRAHSAGRADMTYDELARYIGARAAAAAQTYAAGDEADLLRAAADAAQRWATRSGTFEQRWVEVVAHL